MKSGAFALTAAVLLTGGLIASCGSDDDATTQAPEDAMATEDSPEPTTGPDPTADSEPTAPDPTTPTRLTPPPPDDASPPATGEAPAGFLDQVIADAIERAGAAADDVTVLRAEAKQWPDGSLGCPQPGMSYTQALVDGFWVELDVGGKAFDYRLDGRGRFRLCTSPTQ